MQTAVTESADRRNHLLKLRLRRLVAVLIGSQVLNYTTQPAYLT